MAEADWAVLNGTALDTTDLLRGVSNAFTKPVGGGTFVLGFRAVATTTGMGGYSLDPTLHAAYNPIAALKGGSVRAAVKRYSAGALYAPMMGFLLGTDPAANAYVLGLSEATGYQIVLKKGSPSTGLDAASSEVLRVSTASYTTTGDDVAAWFHLRLDILVNPHSEVVLNVYRNVANVTTPTWAAIPGMASYTDDSLGVLTASAPYVNTLTPFIGHYTEAAGSVSLWDQIEVFRQTAP